MALNLVNNLTLHAMCEVAVDAGGVPTMQTQNGAFSNTVGVAGPADFLLTLDNEFVLQPDDEFEVSLYRAAGGAVDIGTITGATIQVLVTDMAGGPLADVAYNWGIVITRTLRG